LSFALGVHVRSMVGLDTDVVVNADEMDGMED
jgi:hypothetical protein